MPAEQAKQRLAPLDTLRGYEVYQAEMENLAEMVGNQVKLKLTRVNFFFFLLRLTELSKIVNNATSVIDNF